MKEKLSKLNFARGLLINIPSASENYLTSYSSFSFKSEPTFEVTLPSGKKINISPSQAKEYNKRLENYYSEFRKYLVENTKVDELRVRTFTCEIILINEGTCPAEDIDVALVFPKFVKVVTEDERFSYSNSPELPEIPKLNSTNYVSDYYPYISSNDYLRNIPPPKIPDWEQKIAQKENGDEVSFWTRNLKHGHSKQFKRFCVIFSDTTSIKSFQITYRITAANLPKSLEGILNVVVEK